MGTANRPVGSHVPGTWQWLLQQAQQLPALEILRTDQTKTILCNTCVLCGQHLQRSGAILPHIANDHARVLDTASRMHPELLNQLVRIGRCHCSSKTTQNEHKCPVHYQILLLHHLGHTQVPAPLITAEDFAAIWDDPPLRAKLTNTCAVCDTECGILALRKHLLCHETLLTDALPLLPLAQSPYMDCCLDCLLAPDLPSFCPVALNLCAYLGSHGHRSRLHGRGGSPGGAERQLGQSPAGCQSAQTTQSGANGDGSTTAECLSSLAATSLAPRVTVTGHGYGGSIRDFFPVRPKGHHADPDQGHQHLEGSLAAEEDYPCPSELFVPDSHTGTVDAAGEGHESATRRGCMAGSPQGPNDHQGGSLELHDLLHSEESPDPSGSQASQHGNHAPVDPRDARVVPNQLPDPSFQSLEKTDHKP